MGGNSLVPWNFDHPITLSLNSAIKEDGQLKHKDMIVVIMSQQIIGPRFRSVVNLKVYSVLYAEETAPHSTF